MNARLENKMEEEKVEVQVGGLHSSSEIKQNVGSIPGDQRPYALVMANPVGNKGVRRTREG